MRRVKQGLVVLTIGVIVGTLVPFAAIGVPPPHRLRILDLGMPPDPVRQGQRIQLWSVKLQSDYNGECLTFLEIRDRDQLVGRGVQYLIKPGEGRYTFADRKNRLRSPPRPLGATQDHIGHTSCPRYCGVFASPGGGGDFLG